MEKFLFGLLTLLVLAVCFLIGLLPASAVEGGSSSVLTWGILTALILGGGVAWLAWMMADMESDNPRAWTIAAFIIAFAVTIYPSADTWLNGHSYAVYAREMAPKVQSYVLAHFDEIDTNHDGIINDDEMSASVDRFSDERKQTLQFMRDNQSEAGHVIGSYTTTTYVWISTGSNGSGYMSPVITTTYIYGVSRADLEHYPDRVIEKWKKW